MAPSLEDYQRLMMTFRRRLRRTREAVAAGMPKPPAQTRAGTGGIAGGTGGRRQGRVETFLEIMSLETPEDLRMKALRARLFQRIVSEMELEEAEDGTVLITLRGHLVPAGSSVDACDPLAASGIVRAVEPARLPIVIRSPISSGCSRLRWPVAITSSPRRSSYR